MSIVDAKSKCPCGAELNFEVKKPNYFTPRVSKIACSSCDSRFLLIVEVDKSEKIPKPKSRDELMMQASRPFVRRFTSRFEIIRLSPEGKARAKNPVRQVVSQIVEKVSKKNLDPKF